MLYLRETIELFSESFIEIVNDVLDADIEVLGQVFSESAGYESKYNVLGYVDFHGSSHIVLTLNCDEVSLAKILELGDVPAEDGQARNDFHKTVSAPLKEVLNTVSGKLLTFLQSGDEILTIRPPKFVFGFVDFPKSPTYSAELETNYGPMHFAICLDSMQTKLMRKLTESEELSNAKSLFLANMSHEVRTPLNSIIGFSTLVLAKLENQADPRIIQAMETVNKSSQHLLQLVESILDMSAIEAGKLKIAKTPLDIVSTAKNAYDILEHLALKRGLKTAFKTSQKDFWVKGDETRIRQIVLNLYSNALKYTNDGSVEILIGETNDGLVKVSIVDTGVGIKEEDKAKIFQKFTQLDDAFTKNVGGTGIGLALSLELARLHNGNIIFDSEYGKGSKFSLLLPAHHN